MPLITITCSRGWYPAEYRHEGTMQQEFTSEFGQDLPELIAKEGELLLGLDPGTTSDGVQVNYELFHPRAVNAPDGIWMKIEFTEGPPADEAAGEEIRNELRRRIEGWFTSHLNEFQLPWPPDFALDLFWGPGHGYVNFANGFVKIDW